MKKNEGTLDRVIRIILAVVIAILYFTGILEGALGIILLVLAGILLVTGIIGFYPLYRILKINTLGK